MWSKKYSCCQACAKTEKAHMAKGLCKVCYLARYRNDDANRQRITKLKQKWYYDNHADCLRYRKEYREQTHFDGQRSSVIARDEQRCSRCGNKTKLVVHHKDRLGRGKKNPNNALDNLETVCRRCHLLEHKTELQIARAEKYATPKLLKCGRWSTRHNACISCGLTTSPHASKGLCNRCNVRRYATR
jgi:5-methylcytosine-specific restriction endonuclease McrA